MGGLDELRGVTDAGDALVIGARTTHYQLVRDPLVAEHCGLLAQAAGTVADPAVRHRGTLGGALAHADPAGDLPAVALALDATLVARGPGGEREIAAADFFVDYLTTSLAAGRDPDRGPGAQARTGLGLPVREVPPDRAGLGDRRRGRAGPAVQRVRRRGQDRAHQHGPDAAARHGRGKRRGRGAKPAGTRCAPRRPARTRARTRRPTCTAHPTTGGTWPGC